MRAYSGGVSPRIVTPHDLNPMPRQQGLLLRGNRWHFNFKVPRDLQEALGKSHLRESLGTSDYREACRKIAYERARITAFFEGERRKIEATEPRRKTGKTILTALTKPDAFAFAVRYLVNREHVCEKWMEEEGRFLEQREREAMASTVKLDAHDLATGEEFRGQPLDGSDELQAFLKRENIECAPTSPAFKTLRPLIRNAHVEHLGREADRLEGRQVQERSPLFQGVNSYSPIVAEAAKAPTLDDLLALREQWILKLRLSGSGKRKNRPQLNAALALCKKHKATLIIAKLDRLARNLHFISGLMEARIEFLAVDNPTANRLTVQILAAVAEEEARAISSRTKAALASAKARGVVLGKHGAKLGKANHKKAMKVAGNLTETIAALNVEGISTVREITAALNARGIATPQGKQWHTTSVHRLLKRVAQLA